MAEKHPKTANQSLSRNTPIDGCITQRRAVMSPSSIYVDGEGRRRVVVLDAKGNDITRSILTQIIVEEEAKGENLLPLSFLRQLISFYGDNMQRMLLPHYLEYSIDAFTKNQEEIQKYMEGSFGKVFPFGSQFEQMGKQNIEMFEHAMRMFASDQSTGDSAPKAAEDSGADDMKSLQQQLDACKPSLIRSPATLTSHQAPESGGTLWISVGLIQRFLVR